MSGHDFEPGSRSRKGRPRLDAETASVANELARRAAQMWADSDGELSIAEAVELAAFRMGVEDGYRTARTGTEPSEGS